MDDCEKLYCFNVVNNESIQVGIKTSPALPETIVMEKIYLNINQNFE